MAGIGLRRAVAADTEFCYRLHAAAMGEYITAIWGWDEEAQRDFHDGAFNPDRWQIITADSKDIGMLEVDRRPGEIYLARIEILPSYQGQGIGSRLIRALIEEAARTGKDFALEVLTVNRRAAALYKRLGLTEVGRGDDDIKIAMRTKKPSRSSNA
jgi:ribosomal protein S18 acetylase RimI-like enzyme